MSRAVLLLLTLVALVALGESLARAKGGESGLAFCRRVTAAIRNQKGACVVFDIDNTLVDTRYRTRAAAEAYARRHGARGEAAQPRRARSGATNNNAQVLAGLPIRSILRDGRATALHAGLDRKGAEDFHRFWEGFFWSPRNFRFDAPLARTVALAQRAKAAGAEVYYLTGRIQALKPGTLAELARLGLPDADSKHVLCKPGVTTPTGSFKREALAELRASGHRLHWFMTDSRGELAALAGARVPSVLVDFPVNAPNEPPLRGRVPTIRIPRR